MTQTDMQGLGRIVNAALKRVGSCLEDYEEGKEKPSVLIASLETAEIDAIREIQARYHEDKYVTYEECMKAFYIHAQQGSNGALFIDFPGNEYPQGLGLDILPPHTHQAGRIVANIGEAPGIFHVIDNNGNYREYPFQKGALVAFTENPHTFTTGENMEVLAFHLPFYDLDRDPRALKLYKGIFGKHKVSSPSQQ